MENFIFCAMSHQNTINEKPKEDPISVKPKENPINDLELQDLQWLLRHKKNLFGFLKMVYDGMGDGDKFWPRKASFTC